MFRHRFHRFSVPAAALVALAWLTDRACADAPEGVIRTFAVVVEPTALDDFFLSDQSLALVVTGRDENRDLLRFSELNTDERFNSTVWAYRSALHVTHDGIDKAQGVFAYWLLTPDTPTAPPAGALTFTGSDSPLILSQEIFYIKDCTAATCADYFGSVRKVHIGTPANNNGAIIVVTAVFSR